jgi:leucyl aminopeptidase (aminopeptidase T)
MASSDQHSADGAALQRAVKTVIARCLDVRAGEDVLIVADEFGRAIGEALRAAAAAAGADTVLALMEPREIDGSEPPRPLAGALAACDVFVAPTSRSLSHTRARKAASEAGARGATMPGATEAMLARAMAIDFERMAARSRAVAALLSAGSIARVSCPRGTALELSLEGREGIADDGDLSAPGAFGNLPCGEGFIAPRSGEGTIVAATLAPLGVSQPPARLTVRDGLLTAAEGGAGERWLALLEPHGERGRNLAELGVGTNERAALTGNVLEDEKVLGSVHVAFGASAAIGGTVSVPVHLDVVVPEATLEVDGQLVLDRGRYVLGE